MHSWSITGRVVAGAGLAAGFTALDWVRRQFIDKLGIDPHPGTLNLRVEAAEARALAGHLRGRGRAEISPPRAASGCDACCIPVRVAGRVPAAIVRPGVEAYDPHTVELVAAIGLRQGLGLRDGDEVAVTGVGFTGLRAVVFDVDGTLVNSIEAIHMAAARAAESLGYRASLPMVRRAMDSGDSLWEMVVPPRVPGRGRILSTLRAETMKHWESLLTEEVRPFPLLPETMEELSAAGLRLAICTGSRGESFLPLERAGLLQSFDPVVTARDVRRPKPDPEGLQRCLELMGCRPEEAVYVGDSRHDVAAARAAGMHVIGVLTGAADGRSLSTAGADCLVAGVHRLPATLGSHRRASPSSTRPSAG